MPSAFFTAARRSKCCQRIPTGSTWKRIYCHNPLDTLQFTRELRGLGIGVIFEEQNINSIYPESEFLIALHGAFAQSESETISENVRWGKQQAMREGKATIFYPSLLGYKKGEDGKPVIVLLRIVQRLALSEGESTTTEQINSRTFCERSERRHGTTTGYSATTTTIE